MKAEKEKTINKAIPKKELISRDIDDEYHAMTKKIQKKYKLSWQVARDSVNTTIAELCCSCWIEKNLYGLVKTKDAKEIKKERNKRKNQRGKIK